MAPMRLVRDDDVSDLEVMDPEEQPLDPAAAADGADLDPSRIRSGEKPAAEEPDGAVEDSADDESSDPSEQSDVQVDLRTLEALLFSTHHPLTAGRLAEMLELESTKPLRRAIKELNEQYVTGDRSFRIEQVAGGYQMLTLPDFGEILKKLHQREVDAK